MQENLNNIIESLLFVSEDPLTVEKLKYILETVDTKQIKSSLQELTEQYEARGGGFKLVEVAGGWQLRSRPEYNTWLKRMLQPSPQRLSKAALETLAIIAYNQPIIRADIEHIRGVDAGGVLRQLLERKLVRVLGRKEIPGRPLIYATTKLFLEMFELKDLKDLPSPKEIEEMSAAAEPEPIIPLPDKATMESVSDLEAIRKVPSMPEDLLGITENFSAERTPAKTPKQVQVLPSAEFRVWTPSPCSAKASTRISWVPAELPAKRSTIRQSFTRITAQKPLICPDDRSDP